MGRKSAPASSGSVTISGAKLDALRAVLCCTEFKGIFIPAGEMLGLAQPKQASTLFRSVITPMGLELKDGKVFRIGGGDDNNAAAAATTAKAGAKRKDAPVGGEKWPVTKKVKPEVNSGSKSEDDATKDKGGVGEGGKVDATEAEKTIKVEASGDGV